MAPLKEATPPQLNTLCLSLSISLWGKGTPGMRGPIAHFDARFRVRICRQFGVFRAQKVPGILAYLVGCRRGASAEAVGVLGVGKAEREGGVRATHSTLWNAKNGTKNPGNAPHTTLRRGEQREGAQTRTSHCIMFTSDSQFPSQ